MPNVNYPGLPTLWVHSKKETYSQFLEPLASSLFMRGCPMSPAKLPRPTNHTYKLMLQKFNCLLCCKDVPLQLHNPRGALTRHGPFLLHRNCTLLITSFSSLYFSPIWKDIDLLVCWPSAHFQSLSEDLLSYSIQANLPFFIAFPWGNLKIKQTGIFVHHSVHNNPVLHTRH